MKRILILTGLAALLAVQTSYAQTGLDKTATQIAAEMGIGWNLGNTMEAGNNANNFTNKGTVGAETSWQDTRTTQAVIDYVKQQGFRSVRIPCAWVMGHITNATDYTIDPAWMARVKEVADYCINSGLYVVINQHWDGGWLEEHIKDTGATTVQKNKDILSKIWTQIATAFRDYDEHLVFAGLNEPNFDDQANVTSQINNLVGYEQTFIDAVRATGGNNLKRVLIIQGPGTNINHTCNYLTPDKLPTDPTPERLMIEVHYYDPWQFWGMEKDENWGRVFYYWGKDNHVSTSQHNATWGEEDYMRQQLQKMKQQYSDKGYPVYIGEFGANWRTITGTGESQEKHNASIKAHYLTFCQTALELGLVPVVWDTNYRGRPSMTIINRKNLSIYNQYMMDAIKQALQTTSISETVADQPATTGQAYNLAGRRITQSQRHHGVYISSGRKYAK